MTPDDFLPPDPEKIPIPEGRYNHAGQAYWYLANSDCGAAAEVTGQGERLAWIQRFQIDELADVLDVRAWSAGERFESAEDEGKPKESSLLAVGLIFSDVLTERPEKDAARKLEYLRMGQSGAS